MNTNFSDKLKELRESLNLTQAEFSEKLNITQAAMSAYEKGTRNPTFETILSIANAFDISLDWLCGLSTIKSNIGKITNYPDLFRLFITILDTRYSEKPTTPIIDIVDTDSLNVVLTLHIDPNIQSFFTEWCKMFELHCNGTIDDELYQLWIDKELKKYEGHEINGLPF